MRFLLLAFLVYATTLAADPRKTAEPEAINDSRPRPRVAKNNRKFHPLRFLKRLSNAESEFAFRLSSWGIPREEEAAKSPASPVSPVVQNPAAGSVAEAGGLIPQPLPVALCRISDAPTLILNTSLE